MGVRVGVLALVFAVWLAGCTFAPESESPGLEGPEARSAATLAVAPRVYPPPPAPVHTINVGSRVFPSWAPASTLLEAESVVPKGATVIWLVSIEGGSVAVEPTEGHVSVYGRISARQTSPLDTGPLHPSMLSDAFLFGTEGRFTFATPRHPEVPFEVLVLAEARAVPGGVEVLLVQDEHGFRFVPPRVTLPPGTSLVFANEAHEANAVLQTRVERVVARSREAGLAILDDGWYNLTLLALGDDGSRGEVTRPLLVDPRAPESEVRFGRDGNVAALSGRVQGGAFETEWPIERLDVRIARKDVYVTTDERTTETLRLELESNGALVASTTSDLRSFALNATDLPPGSYRTMVALVSGVRADWSVEGIARLSIEPPLEGPSLK